MPAIIEAESPTGEKTYIFAGDQSVMQRTRSTADELCKGTSDSGFSSPTLTSMIPAMRRVQVSNYTLQKPCPPAPGSPAQTSNDKLHARENLWQVVLMAAG